MIEIYTDGSCSPNPGRGGWGVVCYVNNLIFEDWGGREKATNNEMEMWAFYQSFQFVPDNKKVIIYTDSKYVLGEIGESVKNGTFTKKAWLPNQIITNKKIKNAKLWRTIYETITTQKLSFELQWVKGHSDSIGNIRADELANLGRLNF